MTALDLEKSIEITEEEKQLKMCKKVPLRGALIVLEGCDRSGKTTQCKRLGKIAEKISFILP